MSGTENAYSLIIANSVTLPNWIFLSKNGSDEYINMFADGCGQTPVSTDDFVYESSQDPIVLRGILKHKLMKRCWNDSRDFYYMDTGYFGNMPNPLNPQGWKVWHRIVKNNLQHTDIQPKPDDRFKKLGITFHSRRHGSRIIVAAPDEKPCRFYGIDQQDWIDQTVTTLKQHTDRPIVVRQRASKRLDRIQTDPLSQVLVNNVHALVTFNSLSAVESVLAGVPVFTTAPNAAEPVGNTDLAQIETPYWPDRDKLYAWACSLSYGQFHNSELKDGTAFRILKEHQ